jgi:Holliday junction resolvase RusA-like endonuclease
MQGRLESLNKTDRWERNPRYRFHGAKLKKLVKRRIAQWILYSNVPVFKEKVRITIKWVEKDRRRDYDNIQAGAKLILDALRKMGRIVNDSQKWLEPVVHRFEIDKLNPRIEVTIEPAAPSADGLTLSTARERPAAFDPQQGPA